MKCTKAAAKAQITADCPWLRNKPLDIAIAEYRASMRQERDYYSSIWERQRHGSSLEEQ